LGNSEKPPTPEQIQENWAKINSMDGAREMADANAAIMALITLPEEDGGVEATGNGSQSDVQGIFDNMANSFKADAAAGVDVIFQFNISGSTGGDWYCVIKDATCTIDGGIHDTPVCTIKMADTDFLAMMGGKLPPMRAFTSGKLKIEGDVMKSQLLEKLFVIG
jgi:putative sterol carrier protein